MREIRGLRNPRPARFWAVSGVWALAILLSQPGTAHAYIDPGSGVLLIQAFLAAIAGSLFAFRNAIKRRVVQILKWREKKSASAADAETASSNPQDE